MGGEETETFRGFLAARWSEVVEAWTNVSCGQRIGWVVGLLLFSPFLVEGSGVILALAVFLPVALLAGLIEHFIPPLWFLLTLFIHIGGVADVVTDLALLGRALKIYFEGQFDGEVGLLCLPQESLILMFLPYAGRRSREGTPPCPCHIDDNRSSSVHLASCDDTFDGRGNQNQRGSRSTLFRQAKEH